MMAILSTAQTTRTNKSSGQLPYLLQTIKLVSAIFAPKFLCYMDIYWYIWEYFKMAFSHKKNPTLL